MHSAVTTKNKPHIQSPNQESQITATISTMPPTIKTTSPEYTPAAKQLDDPRASPTSPNQAITEFSNCQHDATNHHVNTNQIAPPRTPSSLTTEAPQPEPRTHANPANSKPPTNLTAQQSHSTNQPQTNRREDPSRPICNADHTLR